MFGVPSSLYVPIISTGIGNIQFFTPKFFFHGIMLLVSIRPSVPLSMGKWGQIETVGY